MIFHVLNHFFLRALPKTFVLGRMVLIRSMTSSLSKNRRKSCHFL